MQKDLSDGMSGWGCQQHPSFCGIRIDRDTFQANKYFSIEPSIQEIYGVGIVL